MTHSNNHYKANTKDDGSHFGYYPALPKEYSYPTDSSGNYIYPLAQINFAEVPTLAGYPDNGVLQFYIAMDGAYGLNFDNNMEQSGFTVQYFEASELTDAIKDFSFLGDILTSVESPVRRPLQLTFQRQEELIGAVDRSNQDNDHFRVYDFTAQFPEIEAQLEAFVYAHSATPGIK